MELRHVLVDQKRKRKQKCDGRVKTSHDTVPLKGLSHEIDFKNFDKKLQNLAYLRDAAGF
jgi:hypothetical protein